jgi:methylated-DNA-[protein]-cysteine S-methyltransferase
MAPLPRLCRILALEISRMTYVRYCESPIGKLTLLSDGESITGLYFDRTIENALQKDIPILIDAERQLAEYFGGWRQGFDLPLHPHGTEFQQAVWRALLEIPFGQTQSYSSIARRLGQEKAVRAVGLANGRNPISILIPCHRVIGANGSLTGYGGGLWRKKYLLNHEEPAAESRLALWNAIEDSI